jgi:RNase H-fold protein (predicted Holliday junction resolvase)
MEDMEEIYFSGYTSQVLIEESSTVLVGSMEETMFQYAQKTLEYIKESYSVVSSVEGIISYENVETVVVAKKTYSEQEKDEIEDLIEKGVNFI